MSRSDQRARQGWDGADAPGAVPRSGAALLSADGSPLGSQAASGGRAKTENGPLTWRDRRD